MSDLDTRGLDKLIRLFKGKIPVARVGILGKNGRTHGIATNAQIGAKHEFGLDGMPIRSWLRAPIAENMQKYLEEAGLNNQTVGAKILKQSGLTQLVAKMGVIAEKIVLDGFATGGFGKWKPSNMAHKKNKQTLVETQQLRNAVTSEVKE